MRLMIQILALALSWPLTSSLAQAAGSGPSLLDINIFGAISGGGGKGVVCHAGQPNESVQLLDLWEAETLYRGQIIPSSGDVKQDVTAAISRLKNAIYFPGSGGIDGIIYQGQDFVEARMQKTAGLFFAQSPDVLRLRGVRLSLTDDSYELARPQDCEIQQIVNYQPNQRILINQDLFEKLPAVSQAALITHEAFYSFLRDWVSESNSIRVRRAIGHVYSGHSFSFVVPEVPAGALICRDGRGFRNQTVMYVQPLQQQPQHVRAQERPQQQNSHYTFEVSFSQIGGSPLIAADGRARVGVPMNWGELLKGARCLSEIEMEFALGFSDPVEQGRIVRLNAKCQRGAVMRLNLTYNLPGTNDEHEVNLTCDAP